MVSQTQTLQLIIPCYNEAERLPRQALIDFLRTNPAIIFILVNDGSSDNTQSLLEDMRRTLPLQIQVISLDRNAGKAEAVRQGMLSAFQQPSEYLGYWDADLATPLQELPRFLDELSVKPQLWALTGARVKLLGRDIRREMHRHYLGRVFATLASITLKLPVYDTQCGAKIFRHNAAIKTAFNWKFVSKWLFDVELLARLSILLRNQGRDPESAIHELPLNQWHNVKGSKVRPRDFIKAMFELLQIHRAYKADSRFEKLLRA